MRLFHRMCLLALTSGLFAAAGHFQSSAAPTANVEDLQQAATEDQADDLHCAVAWLTQTAQQMIRASRRTMPNGVAAFLPQVGSQYNAFWLRDYAYMLEGCGEVFSDQELVDAARTFVEAQRADGAGVDTIKLDGTAIYKPGFGKLGVHPVADGSPFTVEVLWYAYQRTKDVALLHRWINSLEKAMAATPRNEQNGLVHIRPGEPLDRCPYGFTDTIPKQGDVLFCSLLYVQASRQMADLYRSLQRLEEAQYWNDEAKRVATSIREVFWRPEESLFRAATVQCNQPDIWGSAFAVYLGVADQRQSQAIAHYFQQNYNGLVQAGQLRHLPAGMYWEAVPYKDRYQNGGYWATPVGWFVYTLDLVDPTLANQTILDLVHDFQRRGIHEWVLDQQLAVADYNASGALPLAGIRRMLARRASVARSLPKVNK